MLSDVAPYSVVRLTSPRYQCLEMLRELKRSAETADIPVVVSIARRHVADIEGAFEVGAYDTVTKPVRLARLGEKFIRGVLEAA